MVRVLLLFIGTVLPATTSTAAFAQRQMENLTRGVVAVKKNSDEVYVGWRLLATDPDHIAFNLYRCANNESPVRVNETPISESTNYVDRDVNMAGDLEYFIRPVLKGRELAASRSARSRNRHRAATS